MTIKDVADKAGVSYTTVSHVINGTRRVAEETALRVHEAIRDLSFEPCERARSLKRGSSGLLGVLTVSGIDPYFSEVLEGIGAACHANGYGILVCHSDCSPELEEENLKLLRSKGADGIIVNTFTGDKGFLERLRESRVPVLVLQAAFEDGGIDSLRSDDRRGAFEAVTRLVALGHERIACVAGIGTPQGSSNQRLAGYREALAAAGIFLSGGYVRIEPFSLEGGYSGVRELFRLGEPPTAVFLYSDVMALGALRALRDLGKDVPGEVSVIGFDDLPLCEFSVPRLSSVKQASFELGRLAVERILERVKEPGLAPKQRLLPVELAMRESAGPFVRKS
jgi:LacI family transcriptional regulator